MTRFAVSLVGTRPVNEGELIVHELRVIEAETPESAERKAKVAFLETHGGVRLRSFKYEIV